MCGLSRQVVCGGLRVSQDNFHSISTLCTWQFPRPGSHVLHVQQKAALEKTKTTQYSETCMHRPPQGATKGDPYTQVVFIYRFNNMERILLGLMNSGLYKQVMFRAGLTVIRPLIGQLKVTHHWCNVSELKS